MSNFLPIHALNGITKFLTKYRYQKTIMKNADISDSASVSGEANRLMIEFLTDNFIEEVSLGNELRDKMKNAHLCQKYFVEFSSWAEAKHNEEKGS